MTNFDNIHGWAHGLGCWNATAAWDRIAYRDAIFAWWAGRYEEWLTIGPCNTREDAIRAALNRSDAPAPADTDETLRDTLQHWLAGHGCCPSDESMDELVEIIRTECRHAEIATTQAPSPRELGSLAGQDDDGELLEGLIAAISHGDDDHRSWLREAVTAFFAGEPVPAVRGSGTKEAKIATLSASHARMKAEIELLKQAVNDCACGQARATLSSGDNSV